MSYFGELNRRALATPIGDCKFSTKTVAGGYVAGFKSKRRSRSNPIENRSGKRKIRQPKRQGEKLCGKAAS